MTWQQLKDMINENENEKIVQEEKVVPITECPDCNFNGLKENKDKVLHCPICGWTGGR